MDRERSRRNEYRKEKKDWRVKGEKGMERERRRRNG